MWTQGANRIILSQIYTVLTVSGNIGHPMQYYSLGIMELVVIYNSIVVIYISL